MLGWRCLHPFLESRLCSEGTCVCLTYTLAVVAFVCVCSAAIAWQRTHTAEPRVEGGEERKLQEGAYIIVLPAQCDLSILGSVGCKEGSLERNWALLATD